MTGIAAAGKGAGVCSETVVAAWIEGKVGVWDMLSKNCVATMAGPVACMDCVAISKDGTSVALNSGANDYTMRVWKKQKDSSWSLQKLVGHSKKVSC